MKNRVYLPFYMSFFLIHQINCQNQIIFDCTEMSSHAAINVGQLELIM